MVQKDDSQNIFILASNFHKGTNKKLCLTPTKKKQIDNGINKIKETELQKEAQTEEKET